MKASTRSVFVFLLFGLLAGSSCTGGPDEPQNFCASETTPSSVVCGNGACRVLQETCTPNGEPAAECVPSTPSASDLCGDGIDNDCDGAVDENDNGSCTCNANETKPCYGGSPATRNQGICFDGLQLCENGVWGNCTGDVLPSFEQANGLDDDCDGDLDEDIACVDGEQMPCFHGAPNQVGVGPCKMGQAVCKDGVWGSCVGEFQAQIEVCNQVDDDCNGIVDDGGAGCICLAGDTMPCYLNASGESIECPAGLLGECKCGETTCLLGTTWSQCQGAVLPQFDTCDGVMDEDCNGIVDNKGLPGNICMCYAGDIDVCYTGPIETYNVGVCAAGTRSCSNGKWGICMGETTPSPEICNGLDDNCDGLVDNGQFFDGVQNSDETDIDCGGTCAPKCMVGKSCQIDADCSSNLCEPMTKTCL